jgi:GTP-binding protein
VERTAVLLHLVDATGDDPAEAYRVIRGELDAYGAGLAEKPEIVALSKADAVPAEEIKKKARALAKVAGQKPLILSAVSGEGVKEALRALAAEIAALKRKPKDDSAQAAGWRP